MILNKIKLSELSKNHKRCWSKEIHSDELELGHVVGVGYNYYEIKKIEDTCYYVEIDPLSDWYGRHTLIKIFKSGENTDILQFNARSFVDIYDLRLYDIIRKKNSTVFYIVDWIKIAGSKSAICVRAGNGEQLIFNEIDRTEPQFELLYNTD